MIKRIVDILIRKQSESCIIKEAEDEIYRYGYILLFEVALNLVIALVIGIVFSKIKDVFFFLLMYIPLRSYCGGWHADKIWKCTIISNVILILQVCVVDNISVIFSIKYMWIIFLINMFIVFLWSPLETKMKRITQEEKIILKRKIKIILIIHIFIMIVLTIKSSNKMMFSMMYVYIIQNMMLIMEKCKKQTKNNV